MNRTLVVGDAMPPLDGPRDGASVLLLDRERPKVPPWLAGAQARGLGEYRTGELSFREAAEEADRLIRQWADARDSRSRRLDDIARYEGIPLWEVAEVNLLYGCLAQLIDELRIWERILEVEHPARLIVSLDPSASVAREVATARGIPVLASSRGSLGRGLTLTGTRSILRIIPPGLRGALRRWRSRAGRLRAGWHHSSRFRHAGDAGETRGILILTLVRRFVDSVIPVIKTLEKDPANRVLVVDRNFSTAVGRLEAEGIPYGIFEQYGDERVLSRVRQEERRLREEWRGLRTDAAFRRHFSYRGVDLWPLMLPTLQEYFTALFPEVIRVVEVTRNLLRTERPAVAVLTDERPPFQRAFTWACRTAGVPTVGIQDTLFPDLPIGSPIATDWIAVAGEAARENLVKRGTPAGKIVVVGQPRFDFVAGGGPRFDREATLKPLGLDPAHPMVLLASQYAGIYFRTEDKRPALQAIYAAVLAVPGLQLLVKLHPEDPDGAMERELAAAAGLPAYRIVKSGDTLELVSAADLVIVFFSTVGHEAIVMDRPLIQVPTAAGEVPVISFSEEGGALDGGRLEELPSLIRAALHDPVTRERLRQGRQGYVRRHVHALDGCAGDRVAELVVRAADARGLQR